MEFSHAGFCRKRQFYRESKDFQPLFFLGCLQECQCYRPAELDSHAPGFSFCCRVCIMQMRELPGRARPSEIVVFNEHSYSNVESSTKIQYRSPMREIIMTPALEWLAELVRQAEAKTRARKIEGETQQAADQFRSTELPPAGRRAVSGGSARKFAGDRAGRYG